MNKPCARCLKLVNDHERVEHRIEMRSCYDQSRFRVAKIEDLCKACAVAVIVDARGVQDVAVAQGTLL